MKPIQLLFTVSAMFFLSSCQQDAQIQLAVDKGSPNRLQGPSDGGGGDTCNGRMIESYKVDITTLDEFKEFVQPILNKATAGKDNSEAANKGRSPFVLTPTFKNWYIIDCKLQDIPADRKGLYLETYQTAIHTSREIFIDSESYGKMAKKEKGMLLLHEMIMSYYLMKYLTLEDICKISNSCTSDFTIVSKWKMFKPLVYRPLDSDDHQKIRNVTAWLWGQNNALTPTNLLIFLKNNDFDKRFGITESFDDPNSNEVEIDVQVLLRMFKKYQWTNSFPSYCQFDAITNASASTCRTEVYSDIRDYNSIGIAKMKQLYLKVKITRSFDQKIFEHEFSFPLVNANHKVRLHTNRIGPLVSAAIFGMTASWPTQSGFEIAEGARSQMLMFMLNTNDLENPEIYQMIFQNYVWYAFDEVIVKEGLHTYKHIYGYTSLLKDESETLFVENELMFPINSVLQGRSFLKMELVADPPP